MNLNNCSYLRACGCLLLLLVGSSYAFADPVVKLQHRTKKDKQRTIKLKGVQYLLLRTNDEEYSIKEIISVSDTMIEALEWGTERNITIPVDEVTYIRKMRGQAEGVGYLVLAMSSVGMVIGVPLRWIKDGSEGAGNQVLGTLAIASLSVPFIFIGRWTTRFNGKKWKLAPSD